MQGPNMMKPAARKMREQGPIDHRVAATLDDIATALEQIERHLAALADSRR